MQYEGTFRRGASLNTTATGQFPAILVRSKYRRHAMRQDDSTNRELLALEKKYWTAVKEKDGAAAVSLSSDPCVIVGAKGVGEIDRKTLAGMLANATHQIKDFTLDDFHIRHVTD